MERKRRAQRDSCTLHDISGCLWRSSPISCSLAVRHNNLHYIYIYIYIYIWAKVASLSSQLGTKAIKGGGSQLGANTGSSLIERVGAGGQKRY